MYKIIVVLGTLILMYFLISAFKYSEITYESTNKKYKYLIEIFLVSGESHQIIIFSNVIYKSITDLLKNGNILIDFNKKLVFNEDGYTKEVLMKDVLVMQMRSEVQ